MFRRGLRLGVPLVMALVCAGAFLGDGKRRAEIAASWIKRAAERDIEGPSNG